MDTNGAKGWAVADCDAVMPFVCAKGESAETTASWQKRTPPTTPSPTPSRTSPTTKSTTLSTTPSTFTTPTPSPPPTPSSPETTTASETTTTAKPTTKATETELSSTTQTSKDGQYTTEEDGSTSSSEVTTSSTSEVPVASSSGMSDSEYRALYAGLGGLALLVLIVVILIILTVKSRKSKKEEEKTKNTKVQRPDIVPQIEQQDNPRESFRRPALAAVGFMPKPGGDDVFNSIAPNQSDTMTYTRPPETLENDDIRLTRSHNDPSLLGIDSPLRRPSATASTLTELSQPSAISYRPVSYAGLVGDPSLHKETTTSTQKRLSRHDIGSVIDQSNDTGLYDDDLSPYGETLANPKKRLPRYDPPSVIEQPSYQTTLPTSSDGVDHIKRSRVLQDGSVAEDIYALPAKRKSILRRVNDTFFLATELTPSGYVFHHMTREAKDEVHDRIRRGGGVGILIRKDIQHDLVKKESSYQSFEMIEMKIYVQNKRIRILVNVPTHVSKNTLDHVCIREDDTLSNKISFEEATAPRVISDHILLLFKIAIMRQKRRKKKIRYRRWATLDKQVFAENVTNGLSRIPPSNSCSQQLQRLTDVCTDVLDTLVPRKSKRRKTRGIKKDYKVLNTLLDRENDKKLRDRQSERDLAERFAEYFTSKIEKIRTQIKSSIEPREGGDRHTDRSEDSMIVSFLMVTDEDVEKIMMGFSRDEREVGVEKIISKLLHTKYSFSNYHDRIKIGSTTVISLHFSAPVHLLYENPCSMCILFRPSLRMVANKFAAKFKAAVSVASAFLFTSLVDKVDKAQIFSCQFDTFNRKTQ
uniref:C-type lectin domain-containing protein n=1 Tax=Capitella teleta TaxID=283909 RepID=X2AHF9_CAPTE